MEETSQDDLEIDDQEVESIETDDSDIEQTLDDDVQAEIEDDSEEIEFNSQSYKLPKEIAEAVKGMQKDYTVKTQTLAEQRRELEAQAQFQQESLKEYTQVMALNERLAEFDQVDWNALVDSDPQLAQKLSLQRDAIKSKRDELSNGLTQKYQAKRLEAQLSEAKQIEEAEREIRRVIKDWSPDLDSKMQDFAVKRYGFPAEYVRNYKQDPKVAKLLHDAFIGQQIIQKNTEKPKVITQAKPVPTVSAKGGAVKKSPAEMSAAEYRKWRSQGRAR